MSEPSSLITTSTRTSAASELSLRVPSTSSTIPTRLDLFTVTLSRRSYAPGDKVGGRVHLIVGGGTKVLEVKALWLDFNTLGDICYRDKNDVRVIRSRLGKHVPTYLQLTCLFSARARCP